MKRFLKRILLLLCGLLMVGILGGGLLLLGQASKPDQTQAELEAAFASGKLVLVAFHSQNCKYCKADEPVLEDLEEQLGEILVVVRVDIGKPFGKQIAQQVGVRAVPAYFLLDSLTGETVYTQQGSLRVSLLIEAIQTHIENGGAE